MSGRMGSLCLFALWTGCGSVSNPTQCEEDADCPGGSCDPVTGTCVAIDASPPPEDFIVFTSRRDGNDEIYRIKADGTEPMNLTNHSGGDSTPVWDPTGQRIAFLSDRTGTSQLFVMDLDGGNPIPVSGGEALKAAWSPDGQRLAFASNRTGASEVFRVEVDGTMVVQLTTSGGAAPDWSSDDRIAYISPNGLSVMQADGTGQTMVPITALAPTNPRWEPERTRIAFHTRFGSQVWVTTVDGSDQSNITTPPGVELLEPRGRRPGPRSSSTTCCRRCSTSGCSRRRGRRRPTCRCYRPGTRLPTGRRTATT